MTVAVQRLNEGARVAVVAHLLALSPQDRSMRFGASLASDFIAAYVDRIDFDRDAVFGIRDGRLDLVGVAHVAFDDDLAELALSVLPGHRGRGVGSALFERAVAHARNRSTPKLFMHFLAGNAPIMRIAQKFGMDIFACAGSADAYLRLIPGFLPSRSQPAPTNTSNAVPLVEAGHLS